MIEQANQIKNMLRHQYGRSSSFLDSFVEFIYSLLPSGRSENGLPEACSAKGYFKIGITLFESGAFDSAIVHWKRATRLNPQCINAYFNISIAYLLKEDIDKANDCFREVLKLDPYDSEAKTLFKHSTIP